MTAYHILCAECGNTEVVEPGDTAERVMRRHICWEPADDTCRACAVGVSHPVCSDVRRWVS